MGVVPSSVESDTVSENDGGIASLCARDVTESTRRIGIIDPIRERYTDSDIARRWAHLSISAPYVRGPLVISRSPRHRKSQSANCSILLGFPAFFSSRSPMAPSLATIARNLPRGFARDSQSTCRTARPICYGRGNVNHSGEIGGKFDANGQSRPR